MVSRKPAANAARARTIGVATPSIIRFAAARRRLAGSGVWDGRGAETPYFTACRAIHESGAVLFTRDTGRHSSGWWKNPDYERCYHLSLSFWDPETTTPRPTERGEAELWVRLFFGPAVRLVWEESAASPNGRANGVRHYRVFCDARWRPIKPRGEIYGKELTERGWKSWSEARAEEAAWERRSA